MTIQDLLVKIDELKAKIDTYRPLPKLTAFSLKEALNLEWIFHSNAIEGNTLTINETKIVLEGLTVGQGKTLREHLEAFDHQKAILYVQSLVQNHELLTGNIIKEIHYLVTKNTVQDTGAYRSQNILIGGATRVPPNHIEVPVLMLQLIQQYNADFQVYHPVILAAKLHSDFVKIHPYSDGNGRTGRLLSNLILMQNGYLPVIIRVENRQAYYEALDIACLTQDYSKITDLFIQEELRSLERYLAILE